VSEWQVATTATFDEAVKRLDRAVAKRVLKYLATLATLDHPRARGKGLSGNRAGYWRYRVGDYRLVVAIAESEMTVVALDVAHRSVIYGR
jgi:mRNA interferase RelE/StbE